MKMLKINKLENENKAAAFTHFRIVNITVDIDVALDVIFSDFVGIDAVAEFSSSMTFEI